MTRLHIYTVHVNPSLPLPYEAAEFVEEGFNWKAFIFTGFWTLYHRLWWQTLAIFLFEGLLIHLAHLHSITHIGYVMINVVFHLFIGFSSNDWLRTHIKKRGYITADIVAGDSLLRAELRFFDRYFAARPTAPFVP
jgi:hypothetical protein